METPLPLSPSIQLALNGRAIARDLAAADLPKARFHFRGFWRALLSVAGVAISPRLCRPYLLAAKKAPSDRRRLDLQYSS